MAPITRTKTGSLPKLPAFVEVTDSPKSRRSSSSSSMEPSTSRSRSKSRSRAGSTLTSFVSSITNEEITPLNGIKTVQTTEKSQKPDSLALGESIPIAKINEQSLPSNKSHILVHEFRAGVDKVVNEESVCEREESKAKDSGNMIDPLPIVTITISDYQRAEEALRHIDTDRDIEATINKESVHIFDCFDSEIQQLSSVGVEEQCNVGQTMKKDELSSSLEVDTSFENALLVKPNAKLEDLIETPEQDLKTGQTCVEQQKLIDLESADESDEADFVLDISSSSDEPPSSMLSVETADSNESRCRLSSKTRIANEPRSRVDSTMSFETAKSHEPRHRLSSEARDPNILTPGDSISSFETTESNEPSAQLSSKSRDANELMPQLSIDLVDEQQPCVIYDSDTSSMSWKSEVESAVSVQPEQFTRLKNRRNLSRFSESLCKPFQAGNEDEENESKLEEEVQLPSFATVVGSDNLDSIVGENSNLSRKRSNEVESDTVKNLTNDSLNKAFLENTDSNQTVPIESFGDSSDSKASSENEPEQSQTPPFKKSRIDPLFESRADPNAGAKLDPPKDRLTSRKRFLIVAAFAIGIATATLYQFFREF